MNQLLQPFVYFQCQCNTEHIFSKTASGNVYPTKRESTATEVFQGWFHLHTTAYTHRRAETKTTKKVHIFSLLEAVMFGLVSSEDHSQHSSSVWSLLAHYSVISVSFCRIWELIQSLLCQHCQWFKVILKSSNFSFMTDI